MKRPIVLLRCSTDLQDAEFAGQRADVERYLGEHGLTVAPEDWRPEIAVSGACRSRPVLERIIDEAERGEVSHILCADFERAGRSGSRTCVMVEDLVDDYGVTVVFVRERWTLTKPLTFDNKVLMLAKSIGGMAKLDSGSRATKAAFHQVAGVRVSRRNGKRVGSPGYEWSKELNDELLALDKRGMTSVQIAESGITVPRRRLVDEDGRLPASVPKEQRKPGVRFVTMREVPSVTSVKEQLRALRAQAIVTEPNIGESDATRLRPISA